VLAENPAFLRAPHRQSLSAMTTGIILPSGLDFSFAG
jgi:hypothetical protein